MTGFVVFAGPSIRREEAEEIAQFDYRPPAAQGDVFAAVRAGASAIGLIDGYFEGVPAVWHKEILFALASGVHVFGASSMGALRAAELQLYGMRGVGVIFGWYAGGALDADDEVALVHGPAEMNYIALSVPLVNVRSTLDDARRSARLGGEDCDTLLRAARSIHFKDRDWSRIVSIAGLDPSLAKWLVANAVDQKKLDAAAMIAAMAGLGENWPGPLRPDFSFERTDAWDAAVESFESGPLVSDLERRVVDEARLMGPGFEPLLAEATIAVLSALADGKGAGSSSQPRRIDRFRAENGLQKREKFEAWLGDNKIDVAELAKQLTGRDELAGILDRVRPELNSAILFSIKARGLYPKLVERATRKAGLLSGLGENGLPHRVFSRRLLVEWFFEQRLKQPAPDDLEQTFRDLALPDAAALHDLIAGEYLLWTQERILD